MSGFAGVILVIFEVREETAADGDGAGVGESFSEVEAVDGSGPGGTVGGSDGILGTGTGVRET